MALHKLSQRRPRLAQIRVSASSICAVSALMVLGGFMAVNMAGCSGGGGGTSGPVTVVPQFIVLRQDGNVSANSTITLSGGGLAGPLPAITTNDQGVAILSSGIAPGTYQIAFKTNNDDGSCVVGANSNCVETARNITISNQSGVKYVLLQNDTTGGTDFVRGTIRLNSPVDGSGPNCTTASTPVNDEVIITVRKSDPAAGNPIVSQIVRSPTGTFLTPAQGDYIISVPTSLEGQTFTVNVQEASGGAVNYAGTSAATTYTGASTSVTGFQGAKVVSGVDLCTNTNGTAPAPTPIPFPTPTAGPTATPVGTATPTATGTATPTPVTPAP